MATNGAAIGTDRRDRFVFGSEIRLALCRRVRRRTSAGQRLRLDACPYRRGFRSDVAGGWLASARQFATERRASFTAAPKKTAGRPTAAKSQTDQIPPSSCSFSSVTWLPPCVTTGGSINCGYGLDKIVCRCRACSGDACDMTPDGNPPAAQEGGDLLGGIVPAAPAPFLVTAGGSKTVAAEWRLILTATTRHHVVTLSQPPNYLREDHHGDFVSAGQRPGSRHRAGSARGAARHSAHPRRAARGVDHLRRQGPRHQLSADQGCAAARRARPTCSSS